MTTGAYYRPSGNFRPRPSHIAPKAPRAMTVIVKQAKVKRAQARISRVGEDRIKILVTDKGVGFEPTRLKAGKGKTGGLGLFSLRERLASLGGHMEVESAPGRGSRFTLIVSLGQPDTEAGAGCVHPA